MAHHQPPHLTERIPSTETFSPLSVSQDRIQRRSSLRARLECRALRVRVPEVHDPIDVLNLADALVKYRCSRPMHATFSVSLNTLSDSIPEFFLRPGLLWRAGSQRCSSSAMSASFVSGPGQDCSNPGALLRRGRKEGVSVPSAWIPKPCRSSSRAWPRHRPRLRDIGGHSLQVGPRDRCVRIRGSGVHHHGPDLLSPLPEHAPLAISIFALLSSRAASPSRPGP